MSHIPRDKAGPAEDEQTEMLLGLMVRFIRLQARMFGLLARYVYLHFRYAYLLIKYYMLKAAGAILVEAVKLEGCIRSLSKEDRVIFAACIAVSIYVLALIVFIRF